MLEYAKKKSRERTETEIKTEHWISGNKINYEYVVLSKNDQFSHSSIPREITELRSDPPQLRLAVLNHFLTIPIWMN